MNRTPLTLSMGTLLLMTHAMAGAQTAAVENPPERTVHARRIATPPITDGLLDDDCWDTAGEWSGPFTQQEPDEGLPSKQQTRVKILYDDRNVYIAFRNLDNEPERINRWLAPRDQFLGDVVIVSFDSYHDRRTAFTFGLSAGGTRIDFLTQNDGDDMTWNAVWEGRTSVDGEGWYAEFRIPLSQLRYAAGEGEQLWGVHAVRTIDRYQEHSHLHLIPRENRGMVYEYATLEGIAGLPRSRRVELTPYTSLRHTMGKEREWGYGVGLDGKIGLSSDFTLDFTVLPDFGQVEADPSVMNLTTIETLYEEKRPFFLEGKNIFSVPSEDMNLFYSRRIGAGADILSAVKVSGKSRNGLSLSVLNSVTAREKVTAQPPTSYSVARMQKDWAEGNTIVGGFFSAVNRGIGNDNLNFMTRGAYVGAVDFSQYLFDRDYYVRGSFTYSHIEGSREAITRLQSAPTHFFQREGAPHLAIDSTLTRLTGNSGYIAIGRGGTRKLAAEQVLVWRSPGFDVNDAGYMPGADYLFNRGYLHWRESLPGSRLLRNHSYYLFYHAKWDYSGLNTLFRTGAEANLWFSNKYYLYACLYRDFRSVDISMLRGGPPMRLNSYWGTDLSMNTDPSKKVTFNFYHGTALDEKRYKQDVNATLGYRPAPNLGVSLRMDYTCNRWGSDYAASPALSSGPGRAYVLAGLKHTSVGLTLRVDYSITPDLSIQLYGSPFISRGKYTDFKRATATLNPVYENRFRRPEPGEIAYDGEARNYTVSEAGGDVYSFADPDFSFREFRFNLVARWEYRPNSMLYLVWSQDRSGTEPFHVPSLGRNIEGLFGYKSTNVLMIPCPAMKRAKPQRSMELVLNVFCSIAASPFLFVSV